MWENFSLHHRKSLQNAAENCTYFQRLQFREGVVFAQWKRKGIDNRWKLKAEEQLSYGGICRITKYCFWVLKFAERPSTKSSRELALKMQNAHFLKTILKCELRLCMRSWWKCATVRSLICHQGMTSDGQSWMLIADNSYQEQLMKLCAGWCVIYFCCSFCF